MKKHSLLILLVAFLLIGGSFLLFYKVRDLDFGNGFVTRFFVRNLSWQTDFKESVPYKKGDELEYNWVFSSDSSKNIALDISNIKNTLEIEHITLDDKEIQEKDLNNIPSKDSSLLKIKGKAKVTNNNDTVPEAKVTLLSPVTKEDLKNNPEIQEPPKKIVNTEPTHITISQTTYSSNINNLITFSGENLDTIDFVNIGEKRIRPIYSDKLLYVQVDKDIFTTGDYFVFFTLKNGKIVTSSIHLTFSHSSSPINIANITPKAITNIEEQYVVLQGNGFDKIVSIQLSNNLILQNAEFKIINNQVAGVKIPKNLPVGEYYFNIMDTHSIYELKNIHFTIVH